MLTDLNWQELKRLHDLGWALHWLQPRSKKPLESKWTSGERKSWAELRKQYRPGYNVGVRLGKASKLTTGGYLAVIDCDVKSTKPEHLTEMKEKLQSLLKPTEKSAIVLSGRGNGSRHIYVRSWSPLTPSRFSQSSQKVSLTMTSARASSADQLALTPEQIQAGKRMRAAWEISLMGEGQQVVLPPSIHPDTGKAYSWGSTVAKKTELLPLFSPPNVAARNSLTERASETSSISTTPFQPVEVDLMFGPITVPESLADLIMSGDGCSDRSAALYTVSKSLARLGFSENEILSVLSDRSYFLGQCAYDHTGSGSRQRAVKWLKRYTTVRSVGDVRQERNSAIGVFCKIEPQKAEAERIELFGDADDKDKEDWQVRIEHTGKDGMGPPKVTLQNVILILTHAVSHQVFKRDLFCFRDTYGVDTPWGGKADALITDTDLDLMTEWFGAQFRFEPQMNLLCSAINVIASKNAFHPIRRYFERLAPWDGKERLETWLRDHAGAADPVYYTGEVFRKWMVAAVTRVFHPGYKFDWMLILEGLQGIGKSLFCETLAGENFFIDRLEQLQNKDAAQNLQGIWIVEMGELSDLKKNELETTKAFITRKIDKYRPPYGRRPIEAPRQCVFAGSTNKEKYLKDDQNRRFVPVRVQSIDMKQLKKDRDQLWAEAYAIFRNDLEESLYLDGRARDYSVKLQEMRKIEDDSHAMEAVLDGFFEKQKLLPKEDRFPVHRFRILDLFEEGVQGGWGPLAQFKISNRTMQFAGAALRRLHLERYEIKGAAFWRAPDSWKYWPTHLPKKKKEIDYD